MLINGEEYSKIKVTTKFGNCVAVITDDKRKNYTSTEFVVDYELPSTQEKRKGSSTAGFYNCPMCIHNFEDRFPEQFNLARWCRNCVAGSNFSQRPISALEKDNSIIR